MVTLIYQKQDYSLGKYKLEYSRKYIVSPNEFQYTKVESTLPTGSHFEVGFNNIRRISKNGTVVSKTMDISTHQSLTDPSQGQDIIKFYMFYALLACVTYAT